MIAKGRKWIKNEIAKIYYILILVRKS